MNTTLPRFVLASLLVAASGCDDCRETKTSEAPPREVVHGTRAFVARVVDGDTLKVRLLEGATRYERVRILGIDCPETMHNSKCRAQGERGGPGCEEQIPLGKEATRYAVDIASDEEIVLEDHDSEGPLERDRYGRLLGYVRLEDGSDFGYEMVRHTPCSDYGWKYPHPRSEAYRDL